MSSPKPQTKLHELHTKIIDLGARELDEFQIMRFKKEAEKNKSQNYGLYYEILGMLSVYELNEDKTKKNYSLALSHADDYKHTLLNYSASLFRLGLLDDSYEKIKEYAEITHYSGDYQMHTLANNAVLTGNIKELFKYKEFILKSNPKFIFDEYVYELEKIFHSSAEDHISSLESALKIQSSHAISLLRKKQVLQFYESDMISVRRQDEDDYWISLVMIIETDTKIITELNIDLCEEFAELDSFNDALVTLRYA